MDDLVSRFFNRKGCAALAVILIILVIAGEVLVNMDRSPYAVTAVLDGNDIEYSIKVDGSEPYDAVLFDRNGSTPVSKIMIYVDENYRNVISDHNGPALSYDPEYMAQQIGVVLSNRGFGAVSECGSQGLVNFLEETISNPVGFGLIVTTYTLPSDVYSGNTDDLLFRWMESGGTIYWVGSEVGRYFVDGNRLIEVSDNQLLFFGTECVNIDGPRYAESVIDNGFTEALKLASNDLLFSVDVTKVPAAKGIGYQADGYSTIVMVPFGEGELCVFAGDFDIDLLNDMGQVIVSGTNHHTTVIDHQSGKVINETVTGTFEGAGEGSSLYIYLGGMYTRFGEAVHV